MDKFGTILGIGFGLVPMILAGSLLIPEGYKELKKAQDSLKWPSTDGIIISSYVKESKGDKSITYEAKVRYKYAVGKKHYSSDQVSFGQYSSNDPEHAKSIVRRYEEGQKVKVYFDPPHPNEPVLEPGVTWSSYMLLGIGAVFFGTGAIVIISFAVAPRLRRKRTEAIKQAASTLALTFLEEDKMLEQEVFFEFSLFQNQSSREIRNILHKRSEDGEAIVFDHEFSQSSGEESTQYYQTVAAFRVPNRNLPEFTLRPEVVFDKVGEFFGSQDIDFGTYPEFSKAYRLQGQPEPDIRKLFINSDILRFFSQNPGWWLEGGGEWLVIHHFGNLVKPQEIGTFFTRNITNFPVILLIRVTIEADYLFTVNMR